MNDSKMNKKLNKQNSSKSNSLYNYKESEELNEKKLNTFLTNSDNENSIEMQNVSNLDSSFKNKINENNNDIDQNDKKSLYENENNYNALKAKYEKLEEENIFLNDKIKKNELIIEEQKNMIFALSSSIENDFFKNNDIKKYITTENIIDFIELKNENEQYKKELVLSQALINSLKSENQKLIKEKEEKNEIQLNSYYIPNSELIYSEAEDFFNNSENRLENNIKRSEYINELKKENKTLKKLIEEATIKLSNLLINEKNNKILSEKNNIMTMQLNEKINIINKYEEKLRFFNTYISEIKSSFQKLQQNIINNINSYNKIANEDLNSLLSNSFSQNMMKLSMEISSLDDIEQYNLDSKPEIDVHNILEEFISYLDDEFIVLYEKVFLTNNYYKESNNKINELEKIIRDNNYNYGNRELNSDEIKLRDEYVKSIIKLNLELSTKESDNFYLNEIKINLKNDITIILNIFSNVINIINKKMKNSKKFVDILNIFMKNINEKIKLNEQKEETIKKMLTNNYRIKKLKLDNKNVNNLKVYEDKYINKLMDDFQKKINEKEKKIVMIKEKINSLIYTDLANL